MYMKPSGEFVRNELPRRKQRGITRNWDFRRRKPSISSKYNCLVLRSGTAAEGSARPAKGGIKQHKDLKTVLMAHSLKPLSVNIRGFRPIAD
jgi:hypothetical protein